MKERKFLGGRKYFNADCMTIRESFAMAALQGICAKHGVSDKGDWAARMAVQIADKTLEELSKT